MIGTSSEARTPIGHRGRDDDHDTTRPWLSSARREYSAVLETMGDFSPPSSDDELPFGSSSPAAAVSSIAAGGQRKRPRPAPAASAKGSSNDDEVVVLDSSSSDSDDCVNDGDDDGLPSPAFGGKEKRSACAGSASSSSKRVPSAAAASKRKKAPVSSSYTSKGYSDSDSSDDDDLLAGGPTFASRPGSGNGSGAASASGQNNDATERLKQTLSRLESLSSAASSAGISSTSATGNKPRKRTAEERAAEAAARKRQKAREVEARKRAREAERAAKARQKEEAKITKARQVLEDKQASGKFAAEEICALVDASLARAGADDDSDAAAFAAAAASASAGEDGAPLPTGVGPLALAALEAKNYRAVIEGQTTQSVRIGDSNGMDSAAPVRWDGLPVGRGAGCVRWIRRDHLAGGSAGVASAPSNDDNVQRTDMVAIVFYNPRAFLRLLERDAAAEARDDYPELRVWLRNVRSSLATRWETRWKSDPETGGGRKGHGNKSAVAGAASSVGNDSSRSTTRIVLVLHKVQEELQRQWNEGGRRRRSFAPTSEEELNDATVWLLIEQHVECTLTSTDDETAEYLANLTRALAEAPYYDDVTELHCVAKLKADSSATTAEEKAKCAWMRQVRQLPGMSEAKARKLLEHYPTLMSLLDEYEDPTVTNDEKKCLLEDCLVEGRKAKKLSESMYRLMTSNDPNELIA